MHAGVLYCHPLHTIPAWLPGGTADSFSIFEIIENPRWRLDTVSEKTVDNSFSDAIDKVTKALQEEGFGILSDIDVAAALKKKLNKDIPPYRILGACNPPLADLAIKIVPSIGLLLPCNVVVRQDDTDRVHVEFMDADAVLKLVDSLEIAGLASEVRQRLERVMEAVQETGGTQFVSCI